MASINYDKWSPIPNSEIDGLCHNKHVPVKVRVLWVIIRMITGFAENRNKGEASIGLKLLAVKTGASKRQIIRAIKHLEAEGQIQVNSGLGRGRRSRYHINFNGIEKGDVCISPPSY